MTFALHKHFEAPWLLWSALKGKMCPCHRRGKVSSVAKWWDVKKNEEKKHGKWWTVYFRIVSKIFFLIWIQKIKQKIDVQRRFVSKRRFWLRNTRLVFARSTQAENFTFGTWKSWKSSPWNYNSKISWTMDSWKTIVSFVGRLPGR